MSSSSSEGAGWIAVVGWDDYVHYSDRAPVWIKLPVRLMSDDAYLELSGHLRSVLCGLLLEYASSSARLSAGTRSLSYRLRLRVTSAHLEALSDAGFIRIVASSALAAGYHSASAQAQAERREEKSKPKDVVKGREERPVDKNLNGRSLDEVLPLPAPVDGDVALERMRARIEGAR